MFYTSTLFVAMKWIISKADWQSNCFHFNFIYSFFLFFFSFCRASRTRLYDFLCTYANENHWNFVYQMNVQTMNLTEIKNHLFAFVVRWLFIASHRLARLVMKNYHFRLFDRQKQNKYKATKKIIECDAHR